LPDDDVVRAAHPPGAPDRELRAVLRVQRRPGRVRAHDRLAKHLRVDVRLARVELDVVHGSSYSSVVSTVTPQWRMALPARYRRRSSSDRNGVWSTIDWSSCGYFTTPSNHGQSVPHASLPAGTPSKYTARCSRYTGNG